MIQQSNKKTKSANLSVRSKYLLWMKLICIYNVILLFCNLKEKDKLQNEILNKKKTLIYKKTPTLYIL